MDRYVVTLGRFIIEQERDHPGATGALTSVLYDLTQAAKLIHREVSKAGLVDILARRGKETYTEKRSRSSTSMRTTWCSMRWTMVGTCVSWPRRKRRG